MSQSTVREYLRWYITRRALPATPILVASCFIHPVIGWHIKGLVFGALLFEVYLQHTGGRRFKLPPKGHEEVVQ